MRLTKPKSLDLVKNKQVLQKRVTEISLQIKPSGSCLLFTGSKNQGGYGHVSIGGNVFMVHRVIWEYLRGKIPDGKEIDHLCKNRSCINVNHLEPVTRRENILRSNAPSGIKSRQTLCKYGHDLMDPTNTIIMIRNGNPNRHCRLCLNLEQMKRKYIKKGKTGLFITDPKGIRKIWISNHTQM